MSKHKRNDLYLKKRLSHPHDQEDREQNDLTNQMQNTEYQMDCLHSMDCYLRNVAIIKYYYFFVFVGLLILEHFKVDCLKSLTGSFYLYLMEFPGSIYSIL